MGKGPNTDPRPRQLGAQRMPSRGEQIKYPIKLIKIKHDASSQVRRWRPSCFAI